jgi:hypothetical protein
VHGLSGKILEHEIKLSLLAQGACLAGNVKVLMGRLRNAQAIAQGLDRLGFKRQGAFLPGSG